MDFPKSKVLTAKQLADQLKRGRKLNRRFCFILGSGASVASGIPTGQTLAMRWMDCIMGITDDGAAGKMSPAETRDLADMLWEEGRLKHSFASLKAAWKEARAMGSAMMPSEYYADIYTLRFYYDWDSGFHYTERLVADAEPSAGYYPLSLLLTGDTRSNLVITTNYDSLVENAVFAYTGIAPLVVQNESLAAYLHADIQRPVVVKLYRGPGYAAQSALDASEQLSEGWQAALSAVLEQYIPIVIGYGGGDSCLMRFLESRSAKLRGLYWCSRGTRPPERVQKLILSAREKGFLVETEGFDELFFTLGEEVFNQALLPEMEAKLLEQHCAEWKERYAEQWKNMVYTLQPETPVAISPANVLTARDYVNRAFSKVEAGAYEEAIADFTDAIRLDPTDETTFYNRANTYHYLKDFEKAIADYDEAIRLNPSYAFAYHNRGGAHFFLRHYEEAVADYTEAIRLNPSHIKAYRNRAIAYRKLDRYNQAEADEAVANALETEKK